jgi:CRP-like cAMP-binding protein
MATEPLTAPDRAAYRDTLRHTAALSDDDLAAAEVHARVLRLAPHAVFLRCGELAVNVGLIVHGLVREYFPLADGREVTRGFAGPGGFVGSLSDLLTGQPARSEASAEADTRLVVTPWRKLQVLIAERPAWAALHARLVERLYLTKAAREYELLALDAEARYARFRAAYAALEPQIALRHVASYVGITPEHLSRLRRRRASAPPGSPAQTRSGTRSSARRSPPAAPPPARRTARHSGSASPR